jgi:hypothetical protein
VQPTTDNGGMTAVAAASTHASVTGVALVVGLMALGASVLFEINMRIRRSAIPPKDLLEKEHSTARDRLVRANSDVTYGAWATWFRMILVAIGVLGLLVAGIAALT